MDRGQATPAASVAAGHAPLDRQRRRILALLILWFCMALIDVGIVNVALPSIQRGLGATAADLQWVLSGYALTFGAVLIAAGRAGDILGRGGVFVVGLVLFTGASLAASLAATPGWLNAARLVEGVGAGCMSPQVYGMVQEYFHGAERGRAFGYLGMSTSLAVAIAPALGGLLIDLGGAYWGWRLAFLVNVPLGIAGTVLAFAWFPHPLLARPRAVGAAGGDVGLLRRLDPVGSLIAAAAVLLVLLPFVAAHASVLAWLALPAGIAAAAAWVYWERGCARRGRPAMVDLALFRIRSFGNGLAIQTVYFLGMTSVWVVVALYAQEGAGWSALATGLISVPAALVSAFVAAWSGKRVVRYGRWLVLAGQAVAAAGLLLSIGVVLLHAAGIASIGWLIATLAVFGTGQGATVSPNQTLTVEDVPVRDAGSAGALVSVTQRIGTSVGIAIVTAVVFTTLRHASWSRAVVAGFALIVLLVLMAIGIGVKDLRDARVRTSTPAVKGAPEA